MNRIPVLITGSGETIVELVVIAEYLEERFPEPALLPPVSRTAPWCACSPASPISTC